MEHHFPIILVIGDVMLDRYLIGAVDRISPEAPVPVVQLQTETSFPGGCGNLAMNLAASGAHVILCAAFGSSSQGQELVSLLTRAGIETIDLNPKVSVTVKSRVVDKSGTQICRIDQESNHRLEPNQIAHALSLLVPMIPKVDCLVFSDYNEGLLSRELVAPLISQARSSVPQIPVFADGKRDPSLFRDSFLIKPNLNELMQWTQVPLDSDEAIFKAIKKLSIDLNVEHVICTLGPRGVACLADDGGPFIRAVRKVSMMFPEPAIPFSRI